MRRILHWDFDNHRHTCWVSCIIEFEVTRNEHDTFGWRDYEVSGNIEVIDVTAMAFEGYDKDGHIRYRRTSVTIAPEWLEVLDRIVTNAVQDDIDNQGPISDELWSYA